MKILKIIACSILLCGLSLNLSAQCSPETVTAVGSYIIYDNSAEVDYTYKVYVVMSDECPYQSSQIYIGQLSFAQIGQAYNFPTNCSATLDTPDSGQSYYYFKIHVVVQRYYNSIPVGSPLTRYSYATYDATGPRLTAMTQPITIEY